MSPNIKTITLTISLILLLNQVNTLNILAIFPYQGKSHFLTFKVFLQELASRGHNLTVASYFPENQKYSNYHDIVLGQDDVVEDDIPIQKSYLTTLQLGVYLIQYGIYNCKVLLANEQVQNLVKYRQKFDLVLMEQFNSDCALGIAHKLEAPVVTLSSHVLMPYHYKRFGIPNNPAYVSFHFLGGGTRPTLYERLERAVFHVYFRTFYAYQQWSDQKTLAQYFDGIPPLEELARNIKFALVYNHFSLTSPMILPPNVIEVGGFHVRQAKPLTGELKKFMDEAEHGVIYISFGSVVKISTLGEDKKQAILGAMRQFPHRFIWKWDDQSIVTDKNKLYAAKWLPQVDILAHPKTVAFISHAGMGGTSEAIHYGVPIIAVPIFGDQPANAAAIAEVGFGVELDINTMTKNDIVEALDKVLNIEFRRKASAISKLWHDRPMTPLQTAVYWTEYAARNANFTFRASAADTPLYQHLNLDIAAVFLTILMLTYAILKRILKACCRSKCCEKAEKSEPAVKGKKKAKKA